MNIKPADIAGIPFPHTDLSARKKRPLLVLTHLDHRGNFIALPATPVRMQQLALCIDENSLKSRNFPETSWVRYDKIFTLNSSFKGFNKNPRLKKETGKNISKNKRVSSYGEKI